MIFVLGYPLVRFLSLPIIMTALVYLIGCLINSAQKSSKRSYLFTSSISLSKRFAAYPLRTHLKNHKSTLYKTSILQNQNSHLLIAAPYNRQVYQIDTTPGLNGSSFC